MRDIRPQGEEAPGRSIRNIHIGHRRPAVRAAQEEELDAEVERELPQLPRRKRRRGSRRLWLVLGGVVVVCAVLGLLVSTVFAGATVTLYPRMQEVTLPTTIQAQLNAPVGVLAYQNFSITKSASQTVPAQGTARVSRPASGLVTVSNTYSAASQRLIANTRFEAADGKIYRIRDSVTVPGMAAGKAGTITATIYADSPGAEYNKTTPTTFTIPGFKGDPRYTKFSAVSEGELSGGFIGEEPTVAPSDLAAAKASLQKELDQQVRAAAGSGIPEGFVAIPGTLSVTFNELTQTAGANKTATLTQSATATGAIVRAADFAAAIARKSVPGYAGEALAFADTSKMDASVASTTKPQNGAITIQLSGEAGLVWLFDGEAIKQSLVGKDKAQFEAAIQAQKTAIAEAHASIRPFWQGKFPTDVSKITIKTASK